MKKQEIYISYAWAPKNEKGPMYDNIVKAITKILSKDFQVVIDKKDLKYKGNIKDFEKRIGKGDKIVLVISDKFLRSKHCMYEVLQIQKQGNIYNRIFPVVLDDARIYDPKDAIDYISHWENEEAELNKKLRTLKSQANTKSIQREIDNCAAFRSIIDGFRDLISNMNTLSPEIHLGTNFKELLFSIKDKKTLVNNKQQKEFTSRINSTEKLFAEAINIIESEIKKENVKAEEILERVKHFHKQCKDQTFQIAVMAMIKSGKSTFLNSLLGDEYLPMSNVPETSVPVKICHTNNSIGKLIYDHNCIQGSTTIKKHIERVNSEKRKKGLQQEIEFSLYAPFCVLQEKVMTDIKFEIIDAPGFGEALTEITIGKNINQSVAELIENISAIIYLLDYSKLKSDDENYVLEKLIKIRADIIDKIQDRMFFIINKVDMKDRNSLSNDEAINFVHGLVRAKMPKVKRDNFITLSASNALLARLILNNKASIEAKQDFGKIAFGARAEKVTDIEFTELASEILKECGIYEVESKIINYIFDNRSRLFFDGLQDNLLRLLKEYKNKFIITAEGALNKTIQEIETLEVKIETAKKKQKSIEEEADKFENEIRDWIDMEFEKFSTSVKDNIDSVFNFEKAEEKLKWYQKVIPSWVRNIQQIINEAEAISKNLSRGDIKSLIRNINVKINTELASSFIVFREALEKKLIERQVELFNTLKQTINTLANEFETTLKKELLINLDVVDVHIDSVDFDRMIADAEHFVDRFVNTNREYVQTKKTQRIYNPDKYCYLGGYENQDYYEEEVVSYNTISKQSLELFWKRMIDDKNANAKKLTKTIFDKNIKMQIKNATDGFNKHVGDYMTTVHEQKIRLTSSNRNEIESRLQGLNTINKEITNIIKTLES